MQKLTPRDQNEKYGYVDEKGNWVIPPQFDSAFEFNDNMARVEINRTSASGDNFIEKSPFYPYTRISNLAKVCVDGKWGMIDVNGNFVVPPLYENIYGFKYNFSIVKLNGKMGFIDRVGNLVIDTIYDSAEDFLDGIAKVVLNGKEGYIDSTGRWYDKNPNIR